MTFYPSIFTICHFWIACLPFLKWKMTSCHKRKKLSNLVNRCLFVESHWTLRQTLTFRAHHHLERWGLQEEDNHLQFILKCKDFLNYLLERDKEIKRYMIIFQVFHPSFHRNLHLPTFRKVIKSHHPPKLHSNFPVQVSRKFLSKIHELTGQNREMRWA